MVAAFREASLSGWRYAMQHPEEVADLILARYSQRHSREHLLFEAAEMRHLMQPDLVEIGHMNPGRWRHIADVYAGLGMLPPQASIDGLIYDPRPKELPAWALPALVAGLIGFALIGAAAWRFASFNRALNAEIVARKEAEQVAHASAANFRRLMDVAPVAVIVTSTKDNLILYLNDHALQEFGMPGRPQAVVGKPAPDFYRDPAQRHQLLAELRSRGMVRDMAVALINAGGDAVDCLV